MTADLRRLRHHSNTRPRRRALTLAAVGVALVCALGMSAPALALVAVPSVTGMPNMGYGVTPSLGGDGIVAASDSWGLAGDYGLRDILGTNDIFTFDFRTGLGSPIAVSEGIQESPDACESEIVWADNRGGDFDIYFYDIVTHGTGPLIVASGDQKNPRTSEPIRRSITDDTWAVVWSDNRDASTKGWDVYCRQGVGGVFPICARAADQKDPDISGTTVVWVDSRNGNPDIYGATYDPVTLTVTEFPVCTNPAAQTACAVDDNWVVWIDRRSGSNAAYGYNRRTKSEFLIAESYVDAIGDPYSPLEIDVSGNTAVWIESSEGGDSYMYGMNLTTGQRFAVRGRYLDPIAGVRIEGRSVLAYNPRFFGGIMGYWLGWGMDLRVAGEPQWVTAPAMTMEAAAATPDTWVNDVRFSANGGATWTAWQALKASNPYTLPAGEGQRTVTAQFRDHLDGVSPTVQATVGLDTVAPTSGNDSDGLWHRTPVTVQVVASDATSGVARSEYRLDADSTWHAGDTVAVAAPADHSADGVHTISYRAVDVAGNVEQAKACQVKIDTTAPTTADNADGAWHTAAYALALTPADAHSGVQTTEYRVDGGAWQSGAAVNITGEGVHAVDYRSTDAAGNVEGARSCQVKIDATAPVTTQSGADDAWHASSVTVRLSAGDALSGIALTQYRLDAGAWTSGDELTVSADGVHTLAYRSRDGAGNLEAEKSVLVKIDTRPPATTCNAPSGWVDHAVEVRFASSDAGCGVDYTEYDLDGSGWTRAGSVLVSGDGVHALSARSVDLLGHIEATRTFTVRIDSVGPSTEALANASVRRGRTATLRYRVSDALSPKARVTIRIKTLRGRTVKTLPVVIRTTNMAASSRFTCTLARGRYRFYVEARDLAGNRQVKMGYGALVVR